MKPEIKRLMKRADRYYEKGLISKEQYQEYLSLRKKLSEDDCVSMKKREIKN